MVADHDGTVRFRVGRSRDAELLHSHGIALVDAMNAMTAMNAMIAMIAKKGRLTLDIGEGNK